MEGSKGGAGGRAGLNWGREQVGGTGRRPGPVHLGTGQLEVDHIPARSIQHVIQQGRLLLEVHMHRLGSPAHIRYADILKV